MKKEIEKMKAMYIDEPGKVEIRDIDMPVRKKGEVLLKLLYGGICGVILVLIEELLPILIIREFRAMSFQRK